jgi:hypothetical protein
MSVQSAVIDPPTSPDSLACFKAAMFQKLKTPASRFRQCPHPMTLIDRHRRRGQVAKPG